MRKHIFSTFGHYHMKTWENMRKHIMRKHIGHYQRGSASLASMEGPPLNIWVRVKRTYFTLAIISEAVPHFPQWKDLHCYADKRGFNRTDLNSSSNRCSKFISISVAHLGCGKAQSIYHCPEVRGSLIWYACTNCTYCTWYGINVPVPGITQQQILYYFTEMVDLVPLIRGNKTTPLNNSF